MHYTTDGTPVDEDSTRHLAPFALRTVGEATATFGLDPSAWRIVSCSSEQGGAEAAAKAIDGDPRTNWHLRWSPDSPPPPYPLIVDLGRSQRLGGFVYQPRAEGDNGTVAAYELHGSSDGTTWRQLAAGEFGNILVNPVAQAVRFATPAENVRYVRFVAVREVRGRAWASCGELGLLGAD